MSSEILDISPSASGASPSHRSPRRSLLPRQTALRHLTVGVIGLVVLFFLTRMLSEYRDNQLAEGEYFFIAVVGLSTLIGLNGQISLGHGALMLVGGYTVAVIFTHHPGFPLWLTLVLAALLSALAGAVIGIGAARLRGPYLAGATLALAVALPALPTHYVNSLGGSQGLSGPVPTVPSFVGDSTHLFRWIALMCGIAAIVVMVLLANLRKSGVGRSFRAVRDDEVSAQLAGLRVGRTQVTAFVVSAACAGLGGGLLVVLQGSANPGYFGVPLSVALLSAAIVGGLGSIAGAAVGSVVLVVLGGTSGGGQGPIASAVARGLHLSDARAASVSTLIYGLELIVVMLVAPGGLAGFGRKLRGFATRS